MEWKVPTLARVANGWSMNTDTMGVYGNYYLKRAIVAQVGLGANLPEDAIYPLNLGRRQTASRSTAPTPTRSTSTKARLPPVDAFWSVTLYDPEGFQVANSLNRFAVSSWMPFKTNADGSLDLYFQNESPGADKEANWLPAPKGPFNLTMRLYAPKSGRPHRQVESARGASRLERLWAPVLGRRGANRSNRDGRRRAWEERHEAGLSHRHTRYCLARRHRFGHGRRRRTILQTTSNAAPLSACRRSRHQGMPDGSVDIYFGPKAPAGKELNWVPTSASGQFEVMFRLYGPKSRCSTRPGSCPTWKRWAEIALSNRSVRCVPIQQSLHLCFSS